MENLYPVDVVFDSALSNSTATQARDTPSFSLLPGIPNCVGMTVLYCQLPFSYYVSDTTNNTFKVQVGSDVYRVYLQPGTYTTTSLVQMMQAILNIQYSSSTPELGGVQVVVNSGSALFSDLGSAVYNLTPLVYDQSTKITFYVGAVAYYSTPFRLDFTESTNCGELLGFSSVVAGGGSFGGSADTAGLYSSSKANVYDNTETLIGNTNYYEAPYTVNLSGPPYLYLHSTLASGLPYGAVRNATAKDDIIQDVVVNNNYQGVIQYSNPYPQRVQFTKTTITSASFYWTLGNRTSFSNSGLTGVTNYLSLQGQTFQVKIRFYIQLDTVTTQGLTPTGNNLLRTMAQTTGSRIPFDNNLPMPMQSTGPIRGQRKLARRSDPASGRPRPQPTSYPTARPR